MRPCKRLVPWPDSKLVTSDLTIHSFAFSSTHTYAFWGFLHRLGAGGVEIRGGGGGNPARRLQQQGEEQGDAWRVQGQAEGQADYPDYPGGSDATTPTPDPNVPSPTLYTPWTHPSLLPNGTPDPSMPTQVRLARDVADVVIFVTEFPGEEEE